MVARFLPAAALALMFYSTLFCSMVPCLRTTDSAVTVASISGYAGTLGPLLLNEAPL